MQFGSRKKGKRAVGGGGRCGLKEGGEGGQGHPGQKPGAQADEGEVSDLLPLQIPPTLSDQPPGVPAVAVPAPEKPAGILGFSIALLYIGLFVNFFLPPANIENKRRWRFDSFFLRYEVSLLRSRRSRYTTNCARKSETQGGLSLAEERT